MARVDHERVKLAGLKKDKKKAEAEAESHRIARETDRLMLSKEEGDGGAAPRGQFGIDPIGDIDKKIATSKKTILKNRKTRRGLRGGAARGRKGTILTGGSGVTTPLGSKRKTLLGG